MGIRNINYYLPILIQVYCLIKQHHCEYQVPAHCHELPGVFYLGFMVDFPWRVYV